ncbi:purine-nucleoside phosphorylase [Fervidobacterium thailandense]|uniref:Purine nucleoside phosphorylase n=1 Tax=Fervidobacterium thailandense TaxID=1008305 RepID=A0A1E3G3J4_9BACT|nr:purine-nucleoside phosphorylase [Fervidobacterium thailandense]ODN30824.1 purine-nucleoside phosphorylase [Fervidobacterium thailandense]
MNRDVLQAVEYIKPKLHKPPKVALILGSGLGFLASEVKDAVVIPYTEIPNFPRSTAPGHEGKLVIGELFGKNVLVLSGRFHIYEGWHPSEIKKVIHVLKAIGVERMLITNAAGAINTNYQPGDIVLVKDVINFMFRNPLRGPNDDEMGPRFPDMLSAFDREWMTRVKNALPELKEGVYIAVTGPSYETPAEIVAFRKLGADLVGMSTVPEVIACAHVGIKVLIFSCATNMAAGILAQPLSHEEVMEVANKVKERFSNIVKVALEQL